jgi:hypothetical protein
VPPNSPAAHRGLWSTSLHFWSSYSLTSGDRRVPRDIPRRRLAPAPLRDVALTIRREERRAVIDRARENEVLDIEIERKRQHVAKFGAFGRRDDGP